MDLDAAVGDARRRYAERRPASATWADRAATTLPGGNTRTVLHFEPFPFRVARAAGAELVDVDGFRYVDLLGDYTAGLLGHSPGPVLTAVTRALEAGWSLGSVHTDEVLLAEAVVDRFPSIEQVRFTNSGTEANLMAIALALHHTGRRRVVVFEHGYHGGVLSFGVTPSPVDVPHDWLLLRYNDARAAADAFDREGDEIACVLVEPMQGSAGCIPGDEGFLRTLRERCSEHGALLVFDEVMTSRLASGGAQEVLDIAPDVTTLGKYLAGGLSFGAFGGRRDVMRAFDPATGGGLGHAGTFNNNVASMAAGVAALTEVLRPEVLDAVNRRGDRLRRRLNEVFDSRGLPMCVTGAGSMMNVHGAPGPVRSVDALADADDRLKELLFFAALDGGYYLARRGFIALSIEVTDADVDGFVDCVDAWASALTR